MSDVHGTLYMDDLINAGLLLPVKSKKMDLPHNPTCFLSKIQTMFYQRGFISLPNHKILDWSKLKAFADDKICVLLKN